MNNGCDMGFGKYILKYGLRSQACTSTYAYQKLGLKSDIGNGLCFDL